MLNVYTKEANKLKGHTAKATSASLQEAVKESSIPINRLEQLCIIIPSVKPIKLET